MAMKNRLELNWIGKDRRPRLEPRILLENEAYSHHSKTRKDGDIFDNVLIKGDNLLALKALEQKYAGQVKCVYIDPPFNTQQAFDHYDDGLEHSLWLGLMRDRVQLIHSLLTDDGSLFIHIDDNELGYLIAVTDEIFGRSNRVSIITFKQGAATGHKAINPGVVSTSNFLLLYSKNKSKWNPNKIYTERSERDKRYTQFIENIEDDYSNWKFTSLNKAFAEHLGLTEKGLKKSLGDEFENKIGQFVIENAEKVIRSARPDYNAVSSEARGMIDSSVLEADKVFKLERDSFSDMYFIDGERILFYSDKLKFIDGKYVAGEPLTSIWDDLLSNNLHKEGGFDFPKGKKPEALIKRCLDLATKPNDLVLDSFAGSGTTGAVAHKMGRRWIMVELGDHCETHVVPRLNRVIDGEDSSGITKAVNWKGGGGYRYFKLAPSLLEKDAFDQWVISKSYNAEMLAEAMCKHFGFIYAPTGENYWQHGSSSTTDFIYVTTTAMSFEQLKALSDEVGPNRSLVVCCKAFEGSHADAFANLTLRKIPNAILDQCEWGHDDYSLKIANLPIAEDEDLGLEDEPETASKPAKKPKSTDMATGELFADESEG